MEKSVSVAMILTEMAKQISAPVTALVKVTLTFCVGESSRTQSIRLIITVSLALHMYICDRI